MNVYSLLFSRQMIECMKQGHQYSRLFNAVEKKEVGLFCEHCKQTNFDHYMLGDESYDERVGYLRLIKGGAMNEEQKQFCEKYGLTEDEFFGREKIGRSFHLRSITSLPEGFNPTVGVDLYLRSLTSLPEGFNPTVGGGLYLSSLTSLPEGFNPTVGGWLDLRSLTSLPEGFSPKVGGGLDLSSLTSLPEGFNPTVGENLYLDSLTSLPEGFNPTVGGNLYLDLITSIPEKFNVKVGGLISLKDSTLSSDFKTPKNIFWENGYAKIDGIFCKIIETRIENEITVYEAKKFSNEEVFFIASKDGFYAHGVTESKAIEDLQFKIEVDKLKKTKISGDQLINLKMFRMLTGACEFGCNEFIKEHKLESYIDEGIKAEDLLKLLEENQSYGFKQLKELLDKKKPKEYSKEWFDKQKDQDPFDPDPHYIPFYATEKCINCGNNLKQLRFWWMETGCPFCQRTFVD